MSTSTLPLVLYNGATGGLGRYMAGALAARGLPGLALATRLEDDAGLGKELESITPVSQVTFIHLAARVSVPACETDPDGAFETNVVHATTVLDRVIAWAARRGVLLRVLYVSTGHVYAAAAVGSRLREGAPTAPRSVYARTKLAAETSFQARTSAAGVPLVVARVFGLVSPVQPAHYVLPGLISRVLAGNLDGIPGLDMTRDYLDARDVCRDLVELATTSNSSTDERVVVNVCSGEPITIRDVLATVLVEAGVPHAVHRAAAATAAPGRPDDVRWLVGDPSLFVERTTVPPRQIPLKTTVRDALERVGA